MSDDQEKKVYSQFDIHQEPDVEAEAERARFLWNKDTPDYSFERLLALINTNPAPGTDPALAFKEACAQQAKAMEEANKAKTKWAEQYNNNATTAGTNPLQDVADFYAKVDEWHEKNYDTVLENFAADFDPIMNQKMGIWEETHRLPENATQDEIDKHDVDYRAFYDSQIQSCRDRLTNTATGNKETNKRHQQYKDMLEMHDQLDKLNEQKCFLENVCCAAAKIPLNELKSLCKLHEDCKAYDTAHPGAKKLDAFNQMWASHLAEDKFRQGTINGEMPRDKTGAHPYEGSNVHSFGLTEQGMLRHSIQNLNNTGLDICTIDGKIGFTRSLSYLTPDQINALADYCVTNHIAIDDFGALQALKIQDKEGKVHKKTVWNKDKGKEEEVDKPVSEMLQEELVKRTGGEHGKEDEKRPAPNLSFSKWLPKAEEKCPTKEEIKKTMIDKFGVAGFTENLVRKSWGGWNSTILSIYGSESDMVNDGSYDKDGLQRHLKKLSVKYDRTRPPSVSYYIKPGEKFIADYARVALAAAKLQGCEYFTLPAASAIGKEQRGAFFEASVKEKMVPLLKSKDNPKGMTIGAGDVGKLLELMDKEEDLRDGTTARLEYMIKWHEQLKAHEEYLQSQNPPKQLPATVANLKGTFQEKILFDAFNLSTKPALEAMMTEMCHNKDPQEWDKIDRLSAIKSMTQIIKDLHEGKLDGNEFDPFDEHNTEKMKKTLTDYMTKNRQGCVDDYKNALSGNKTETDSTQNKAIQAVEQSYMHELNEIVGTVKANGGPEMKVNDSFPKPTIPYDENRKQEKAKGASSRDSLYGNTASNPYNRREGRS